jgi:quercetin dioxygenase-like cupin family protein/pyrroloquinoline quinone (PQQ) biosynthesis protein C
MTIPAAHSMNDLDELMKRLQADVDNHPLWSCRLLAACDTGRLTIEDFRVLFGQYQAYSRNFTRYLAGVMLSCNDDMLRALLSHNLWEEGGGALPEERHAEIFRCFLVRTLGLRAPSAIVQQAFTTQFVERYLAGSSSNDNLYGAAFLALGTEGIVARMYRIFIAGMLKAGIPNEGLQFFHIHVGCDDEHAATLLEMVRIHAARPDFESVARSALEEALSARLAFFDAVYDFIQNAPTEALVESVRSRRSLLDPMADPGRFRHTSRAEGVFHYANENQRLNIEFTVEKLLFPRVQVLDPRIVRIAPGKNNERHKHAHESIFSVISGRGEVVVGDRVVSVQTGDTVFVPRWTFHQSCNKGDEDLVLLAITDFGLTSAVLGDYDRGTRLRFGGENAEYASSPTTV